MTLKLYGSGSIENVDSIVTSASANISGTELGYIDGVGSDIQTQIDNKASIDGETYSGTHNFSSATLQSNTFSVSTINLPNTTSIRDNRDIDLPSGSYIEYSISAFGFIYFLLISNTRKSSAGSSTYRSYVVAGRQTTFTASQLSTINGVTGGASFSVSIPTAGTLRITNTSGYNTLLATTLIGHTNT